MAEFVFPALGQAIGSMDSSVSCPGIPGTGGYYNQRLPSDPMYKATILLQNIVVGSRYWIARASDLSTVLAEGVASTTEVELPNIPAYNNAMLFEVRVRKGSGSPNYEPYKTFGYLVRDGATVYIAQVEDEVNVL